MTICVASIRVIDAAPRKDANDSHVLAGWPIYDQLCLACHGARGDGAGPAARYTRPRPRDFTRAQFAWRSTAIGSAPLAADVRDAIRFGAPGTSMPGFGDVLSAAQLDDLVAVVESFAPTAFAARPAAAIAIAAPPMATAPARGAQLWTDLGCASCHGATGAGDGPAASAMRVPPFDLTAIPLHRPRDPRDPQALRTAAARDIATGIAGTAMPGYAKSASGADIWALADYVVALAAHASDAHPLGILDRAAIADDRAAPIAAGTRPAGGDPDEDALFATPIAPQGAPPPSLAPAQASLRSAQCGRCHAKQVREWTGSIHGAAMSVGARAELAGLADADAARCRRCHAPLAEQSPSAGAPFDAELALEGVTCAGCHLRSWARRGPPQVAPSLLALPGYPLATLAIYERGDLCMTCHQLPPRDAVRGKPLLNTYAEWLDGPYARRGVQCQHCHLPNREHSALGIHDAATVRQGIAVTATAARAADGSVTVSAAVANIGAGHDLPTTTTPALWLSIELLDAAGAALPGGVELRIGRDVEYDRAAGAWRERADTRIAPGAAAQLAHTWSGGRTKDAAVAHVTVRVHPDEFYERVYAGALADPSLPAARRALYEQARARAIGDRYVADDRRIAL